MSDRGDATTGGPGDDGPGSGDDADEPDGDDRWRFSLDDVGPSGAEPAGRRRTPIEPGDPSLENVLFVLLGVVLTLFVLSRLVIG